MLSHVIAVLGLLLYGFEVYRTVERFGAVRTGMAGMVVGLPKAHMALALLLLGLSAFLASVAQVPIYVGPAGAAISVVYLFAAARFRRRQKAERERKGK